MSSKNIVSGIPTILNQIFNYPLQEKYIIIPTLAVYYRFPQIIFHFCEFSLKSLIFDLPQERNPFSLIKGNNLTYNYSFFVADLDSWFTHLLRSFVSFSWTFYWQRQVVEKVSKHGFDRFFYMKSLFIEAVWHYFSFFFFFVVKVRICVLASSSFPSIF